MDPSARNHRRPQQRLNEASIKASQPGAGGGGGWDAEESVRGHAIVSQKQDSHSLTNIPEYSPPLSKRSGRIREHAHVAPDSIIRAAASLRENARRISFTTIFFTMA